MAKQIVVKTEVEVEIARPAVLLDSTNAEELIQKFNEAKAAIKQLEAQKLAAEAELRKLMGDAEVGFIKGVERVKISARSRKDIDKETLLSAFPEAYALCLKEINYTILTAVS